MPETKLKPWVWIVIAFGAIVAVILLGLFFGKLAGMVAGIFASLGIGEAKTYLDRKAEADRLIEEAQQESEFELAAERASLTARLSTIEVEQKQASERIQKEEKTLPSPELKEALMREADAL